MISSFLRRSVFLRLLALVFVLAACGGGDDGVAVETADDTPDTETSDTLPAADRGEINDPQPASPQVVGDPSTPSGLAVVGTGGGTINLVWDASRDADVTRYRVLRTATGGAVAEFEVLGTSFSDEGLEDGDIFSYRIIALREGFESEASEGVTARVGIDSNPPRRPGRPEVIESATGQSLTWAPSEDVSGISTYVLTREVGGVETNISVGPETSFADSVPAGTVVTYTVRAVDGGDNVSEPSRSTTLLTGTPADRVAVVVSAQADASNTAETARFERELLDAGYTISWFEDGVFDSNVTTSDDVVILLGDVLGEGFDWNVFATDATVVGLKSSFITAGGFVENLPKLDRIQSIAYNSPTVAQRFVAISVLAEPKPVVFLPPNEQLPDLEVLATASFSAEAAVAGFIPAGGELANGNPATGCRAFFPGNTESFTEMTDAGWDVLVEFIADVESGC